MITIIQLVSQKEYSREVPFISSRYHDIMLLMPQQILIAIANLLCPLRNPANNLTILKLSSSISNTIQS